MAADYGVIDVADGFTVDMSFQAKQDRLILDLIPFLLATKRKFL